MRRSITHSLRQHPEELAIIGDMVFSYSELEFKMLGLVGEALNQPDLEIAGRVLFRLKGANDRLNVSDAIIRPSMDRVGLLGPYTQLLGAMRKCRVIRNYYAHSAWSSYKGRLQCANLEETAQTVDGTAIIDWHPVFPELLEIQHQYFVYTADLTMYVLSEAMFRNDRRRRHKRTLPKSRAAPPLRILPG